MRRDELLRVIILAAGASRRLGRDKALLPWPTAERPLVRHVAAQFPARLCSVAVVVANVGNEPGVRRALPERVRVVINPDPQADMLSSLRRGLAALGPGSGPLCVHPVDVFALVPRLVCGLHRAWREKPLRIHVPAVAGRRAHPVIIPARFVPAIAAIPAGCGLNRLLADNPRQVVEHAWDDEALLADLDTPGQYRRYRPPKA